MRESESYYKESRVPQIHYSRTPVPPRRPVNEGHVCAGLINI